MEKATCSYIFPKLSNLPSEGDVEKIRFMSGEIILLFIDRIMMFFLSISPSLITKDDWTELAAATEHSTDQVKSFYSHFSTYLTSRNQSAKGL